MRWRAARRLHDRATDPYQQQRGKAATGGPHAKSVAMAVRRHKQLVL
jgi:hypothetical protein